LLNGQFEEIAPGHRAIEIGYEDVSYVIFGATLFHRP